MNDKDKAWRNKMRSSASYRDIRDLFAFMGVSIIITPDKELSCLEDGKSKPTSGQRCDIGRSDESGNCTCSSAASAVQITWTRRTTLCFLATIRLPVSISIHSPYGEKK